MDTTSHPTHSAACLLGLVLAIVSLATAAPAYAGYGWPVKPFHQQHPVRGYFGDPRIAGNDEADGTFHFGIDISAPNGTAVYATLDGVAGANALHSDVVEVSNGAGTVFEYWHVIPAVRPGDCVVAYRTVVGHIEAPWSHVHFSEIEDGVYVNPLRPGALGPYRDTTRPTVHLVSFERNGTPVGDRLAGTVDVVAEASDETPLLVPAPWSKKPVTPALVEWRIAGPRALAGASWHVAADFRRALPTVPFSSVYARWTRQNHAWSLARYRFVLLRGWDTRSLANGTYRLVVRVTDTRGNTSTGERPFVVVNGV
jgi:hypothetical protein